MKLIIITTLIALTGCGVVSKADWKEAEKACKNAGGVKFVEPHGFSVTCKNGQEITKFNKKSLMGS